MIGFFGGAPWEIKFDGNGNVVFTEFVDITIGRFAMKDITNPQCQKINSLGINPCIEEIDILPELDHKDGYGLHSIAYDKKGNLWFTPTASNVTDNNLSIGYLTSDWQDICNAFSTKIF